MKRNGFTLTELLVAVVISTVLASVAVPKFRAHIAKARAAQVPVIFSAIAKAQHISFLETQEFFIATTQEEYLSHFGLKIPSTKYFNFETGPTYAELVAAVEIDGIPMVEAGFYIDAVVQRSFGKLSGGEVVEYDYNLFSGEEKATTENAHLQRYLINYLFINDGRYAMNDGNVSETTTKTNNGHGNNESGFDISNPGNKTTDTIPEYDDEKVKTNNGKN